MVSQNGNFESRYLNIQISFFDIQNLFSNNLQHELVGTNIQRMLQTLRTFKFKGPETRKLCSELINFLHHKFTAKTVTFVSI